MDGAGRPGQFAGESSGKEGVQQDKDVKLQERQHQRTEQVQALPLSEKILEASQRVSAWGVCGTVIGGLAGMSTAVVNSLNVGWYATRVGVNTGILGCCVGGLNEGITALRGGTRDAYNMAISGGVTGFLASVQRSPPRRAGVVGCLCAGLGAGGHFAWVELMRMRSIMSDERRIELGMDDYQNKASARSKTNAETKGKLFPPMKLNKRASEDENSERHLDSNVDVGREMSSSPSNSDDEVKRGQPGYLMRWIPVRPISDEELRARKELDRESKRG